MIVCRRCGQEKAPMDRAVYPGALGKSILAGTCRDCWNEWREMEVRVINELRLNFLEPEAQETLSRHLVDFLGLSRPQHDEPEPPAVAADPEDEP